jgi:S-adenosyl methyltransferase
MEELPGIDTSVPHSARIYDYILGGQANLSSPRQPRGVDGVNTSAPG